MAWHGFTGSLLWAQRWTLRGEARIDKSKDPQSKNGPLANFCKQNLAGAEAFTASVLPDLFSASVAALDLYFGGLVIPPLTFQDGSGKPLPAVQAAEPSEPAAVEVVKVPEPKPDDFRACWAYQTGKTQEAIAEMPGTSQGQVSKMLTRVERWLKAGSKMPEISGPEPLHSQPQPMDPTKLDLGPRADHRSPAQVAKLAEISGHGWGGPK